MYYSACVCKKVFWAAAVLAVKMTTVSRCVRSQVQGSESYPHDAPCPATDLGEDWLLGHHQQLGHRFTCCLSRVVSIVDYLQR